MGKGKALSFGMEIVSALPGFSCRRCASCCKGKVVVLTDQDISRLKPHAKKEFFVRTSKLEKILTGAEHKILMVDGHCVFLNGNFCTVYEYRPDTCRRHPFLVTDRYILVAKECPGIDWGRTQKTDYYKELSKSIAHNIEEILDRNH
ncbi:MAG: YkgJ family cysteine cluster protein [Candidatus Methanomethyliaceae archaeon]|nr:YkgJ family cysteine cluster protein [Candidatus Methanomethyliaceae archaeon]